jgi:CRP/FNR family cyclic AMP-dependent transcriptional regulator
MDDRRKERISDTRILHPFTISKHYECPIYAEEDAFSLSHNLIYTPIGKPTCLTLSADVMKLGAEVESTGSIAYPPIFSCSGCMEKASISLERPKIPTISPRKEQLIVALQEYSFFRLLRKEDIYALVPSLEVSSHDIGEVIIRKDEPGQSLFLILSGKVTVFNEDDGESLALFGTGSLFGEMSLLTGDKTSATITVAEPVSLLVVQHSVVRRLVEHHPKLQNYFYKLLSDRLTTRHPAPLSSGEQFRGTLDNWTLPEVLQTLNLNQKSGILEITRNELCAHVLFHTGEIVAVHFNNLPDIEAFYELFKITNGEFSFHIEDPTQADFPQMSIGSFMQLMMEAVIRSDEIRE